MTLQELISSGLLESYVLGTTTDAENELIQRLCRQYPELLAEIESIEKELIRLSSQAAKQPDADLREKIETQLDFDGAAKIIPVKAKTKSYQFALAASLLLFVASFVYNMLLQQRLNRANDELAQLNADKSSVADQLKIQQAAYTTMSSQFAVVTNPKIKTVTLNGMNYLANHAALVHWNAETHEVYFDAQQLPACPEGKQYQLWAMVNGQPVDAGTFDPDNLTGFQKMKNIAGAQAFAVTIEKAGGSSTPALEAMCLLGNV